MYIDTSKYKTKSGKITERVLIRSTFREDGKIKHNTILNISNFPKEVIEAIKLAFKYKGDLTRLGSAREVELKQEKHIGSVWTAIQIANQLGLGSALGRTQEGRLALFQVIARLINQGSRRSCALC